MTTPFKTTPHLAVVRKEVQSLQFGFYSDKDVLERSVVEITSPQTFDPNSTALPGGLYDPRMGPTTKKERAPCPTCALSFDDCPGHFGHIALTVPVYHPLLFPDLINLLRCKCLNCHRLKAAPRALSVLSAKFALLSSGHFDEMKALDDNLARAMHKARDNCPMSASQVVRNRAAAQALDDFVQQILDRPNMQVPTERSTQYRDARKSLIKEVLQANKSSNKCHHCGALSPRLRQDAHNKIFQVALTATQQRLNAAENIEFSSALLDDNQEDVDETTDPAQSKQSGYDSEDTEVGEEDIMDTENVKEKSGSKQIDKYMHPGEVQAQLKRTWSLDTFLCNSLFGTTNDMGDKFGYQVFFLNTIPVPPSRFRPPMFLNGMAVEHSQTQYLSKILMLEQTVKSHFTAGDEPKAYTSWMDLQTTVNCFMDSSKDQSALGNAPPGIKQILERKEGLFRKHMMGKRVNHACRSVISPDPYVGTNEIGLPYYFASVLTFPTPVTDLNIGEMRELVTKGTQDYPGARWVEVRGKRVDLSKMNREKREAVAAKLLMESKNEPVLVGRQLRDGDYVLMNRQPTLHKPGIMAHRVRVLHNRSQRTIRMHYANCNTYNADFDGDEMNCHYPQNYLGRAEAQFIANTDLQYIVPTDGSPLRGLIQDHVVGGVQLTKRDTFLERWAFQQLVYASLASLSGLEIIRSDMDIEVPPPAILRPRELWTGKQVVSALLLHLGRGHDRDSSTTSNLPGLCMERKAKTPDSAFGADQEEHLVLVRDSELLRGVLDKAAFGATDFSLVHAVYEAYGPEKAGLLLNAFGRLFTSYIQFFSGHSCRVEDLVLTREADSTRRELVQRAYTLGARAAKAWADSDGGKVPIPPISEVPESSNPMKPFEAAAASAKIGEMLSGDDGKENFAALDSYMQGQLNPLSSGIVKKCLPSGLAIQFPYNTFSIMTTTGAKGSIVNQSQVTCALGQQALEGRRVPRMSSGRTLPSFAPYDPHPRADGFVMDRFLTGIRPQEYYFHCMAGREGLVDTAVKTSRSGYLQRCLIKHLEELSVKYDFTVRNAEGAVVQFLYGEDGLDPTKASYLDCSTNSFEFLARNYRALKRHNICLPSSTVDVAAADVARNETLTEDSEYCFKRDDFVMARRLRSGTKWVRGALLRGWWKALITELHSDGTVDIKYLSDGTLVRGVPIETKLGRCGSKHESALSNAIVIVKPAVQDPVLSGVERGHRLGSSGACVSERVAKAAKQQFETNDILNGVLRSSNLSNADLSSLISAKYSSSLCAPGEAVGSIAAQSVGEPSTQMTLNTFHLAGAGANVTLGIPRLREIIMTASRDLKTPTMSVPLSDFVSEKHAIRLTRDFSRLALMELISGDRGVAVTERLESVAGTWERAYYVSLKFHPAERIREAFGLSLHDIAKVVARSFVPLLSQFMKKELRRAAVDSDVGVAQVTGGDSSNYIRGGNDNDEDGQRSLGVEADRDELNDEDDDDDDEVPGDEDGVEATKFRQRQDSASYDDDDVRDDGENDDDVSKDSSNSKYGDDGDAPRTDVATTPFSPTIDGIDLRQLEDKTSLTVVEGANSIILQPLRVDPAARPLLMVGLVEKAAEATLVRSRKNIKQAFLNDEPERGRCLQSAGINFEEIWELENVNHSKLMSNDIWAIHNAYGVEAARSSIVEQIRGVFGAYGIEVDPRHLSLIADYMTFGGGFKPMNRIGMEDTSSTLLQMSFETTVHFLKQASLSQSGDSLNSPSANLVVGRPVKHGTGAFSLLVKT